MAVHAHPDDEAIGTGGILAQYGASGVRTVLVTCTNGEQGDDLGGVKPGEPGHRPDEVAAVRLAELRAAVEILGVSHLETLGYRDSGMAGWSANADPDVFCNVPVDQASERLEELMRRYQPQVVVTYDENGGYGHPDHIQAHRVTVAAAEATGVPAKLYYAAIPRSAVAQFRRLIEESGADIEGFDPPPDFGTPDEEITAVVDVSAYTDQKLAALNAHASQTENFPLNRLPKDRLAGAFSREAFILRGAPGGAAGLEDDLFAGLR